IHRDMVAVRLTPPFKEVHFGSPAYFARAGRPRRPQDLLQHSCIHYRYIGSKRIAEWQFKGTAGVTSVDVNGGLIVDSTQALVHAARDGLGIAWLYRPNIADDLRSGALESVLEGYAIERPGFFLYYPRANARLGILRVFIDFFMKGR